MFEEIVKRYGVFADAILYTMHYTTSVEAGRKIDLEFSCTDATQDNKRFRVLFSFLKVSSFIFDEKGYMTSSWVINAFLDKQDDVITFDFFPWETEPGGGVWKEDPNTRFHIKCEAVTFEVLREVIIGAAN